MRAFSTASVGGVHASTMTREQAELLHEFQIRFEKYPTVDNAYKLFRELNKHHMYISVIRLYWKHEMSSSSTSSSSSGNNSSTASGYSMMQSQYEFAKDHLKQNRPYGISDNYDANNGEFIEFSSESFYSRSNKVKAVAHIIFGSIFFGCAYYGYKYYSKDLKSKLLSGGIEQDQFEFKKSEDIKERLDDVKGIDEIKDEIVNLIRMIRDPDAYTSKGAKMHKGVLLFGDPGTGKTMLSRAIAGEAGVSFLYCTGSSFDEMYVGVGAKRVRELFIQARKQKPCIIFIDEIDTLLSASRRHGGEHSSARATINQVLTELDGFEQNDNILVIGATNHKDSLDPAAVRPGRFDKKIHVPKPDVNGREAIFEIYLEKIAHNDKIEAKKLATMTPGFTGAEIENLVNTAILEAVHNDKEEADLDDFEYARDRLMMGIERKRLSVTERERLCTAFHEAGHTVACHLTPNHNKLYKATIVARGGSLGATYFVPDDSDSLGMKKDKLIAHIDVCMGGHCAEELFIGKEKITSGCSSDLQQATNLANKAVNDFGMFGEDAGYISKCQKKTSQQRRALIDQKVQQILKESKQRVTKLLQKNEEKVREVAINLYKYDYLDKQEVETIIAGKKLDKSAIREFDSKIEAFINKQ